jgi:hypothetical protein
MWGSIRPWPDETQFTKSNFIAPVPPPYSFFFLANSCIVVTRRKLEGFGRFFF